MDYKHICPEPTPLRASLDLVVVLLYVVFILSLRRTHAETSDYVKTLEDVQHVQTSDYSIMVENPPPDATDPVR